MRSLVWDDFVKERRGWGDSSDLVGVDHPDRRLLRKYQHRGPPVIFPGQQYIERQQRTDL